MILRSHSRYDGGGVCSAGGACFYIGRYTGTTGVVAARYAEHNGILAARITHCYCVRLPVARIQSFRNILPSAVLC